MDTKRQEALAPVVAGGLVQRRVAVKIEGEPKVGDYDRLKLEAELRRLTGKEPDFEAQLTELAKRKGIGGRDPRWLVKLVAEKMRGGA